MGKAQTEHFVSFLLIITLATCCSDSFAYIFFFISAKFLLETSQHFYFLKSFVYSQFFMSPFCLALFISSFEQRIFESFSNCSSRVAECLKLVIVEDFCFYFVLCGVWDGMFSKIFYWILFGSIRKQYFLSNFWWDFVGRAVPISLL